MVIRSNILSFLVGKSTCCSKLCSVMIFSIILLTFLRYCDPMMIMSFHLIVGHPEPEKKNLLAFLSTFWHPCSKCILMCFKKDRGGCQVWKCPKVPELGQWSTEFKFLYIHQILAFLSISYPKL